MATRTHGNALGLAAACVALATFVDVAPTGIVLAEREADAVVGRPFTPVSYAGMARRTSRRTARRTTRRTTAGISALPAGCALAGGIYTCGAVRYRPYYDGPNLVYVRVD